MQVTITATKELFFPFLVSGLRLRHFVVLNVIPNFTCPFGI